VGLVALFGRPGPVPVVEYPKGGEVARSVAVAVGDPIGVSLGGGCVCEGCSVALGSEVLVGLAARSAASLCAARTCAVALICSGLGAPEHAVSRTEKNKNVIKLFAYDIVTVFSGTDFSNKTLGPKVFYLRPRVD